MSEEFHDIELNIDDLTYCGLVEFYIRNNFSEATVDRFKRHAENIGIDREAITKLAGEAIFNEAALQALEVEMLRKQKELKEE